MEYKTDIDQTTYIVETNDEVIPKRKIIQKIKRLLLAHIDELKKDKN